MGVKVGVLAHLQQLPAAGTGSRMSCVKPDPAAGSCGAGNGGAGGTFWPGLPTASVCLATCQHLLSPAGLLAQSVLPAQHSKGSGAHQP